MKKSNSPLYEAHPDDPDSPFLTAEWFKEARPFREVFPHVQLSARNDEGADEKVAVMLPKELVSALQQTGDQWPAVAADMIRSGLKRRKKIAA